MNVFMANVGERDIALRVQGVALVTLRGIMNEFPHIEQGDLPTDIQTVVQKGGGTRYLSAQVRDNIGTHKKNLHFPIIRPALQAVLEEVDTVDQIVLFATDQDPDTPGGHYSRDSMEGAERLKEILIPCEFGIAKGKIEVVKVAGFNPSQHEPAYEFIGKKLEKLKIAKDAKVFASIKGGIPGMNSALRERIIQHFGPRAWLVETNELSGDERAVGKEGEAKVTSSWPFRQQSVLRLLEDFLNRHDYSAAWRLLTFHAVKSKKAKAYVEHALARTNLDFDGAAAQIRSFASHNQEAEEWMNSANDASGLQRLDDLAESAQVAFERRDYVGFLNRVKTFCEICLGICGEDPTNMEGVRSNLGRFNGLCNLRNTLDHDGKGVSLSDLKKVKEFSDVRTEFRPLTKEILEQIKEIWESKGEHPQPIIPVYNEINKAVLNLVENWNP